MDLGLSYPTAWSWCHKIRKAMEDRETRYSLRGIVELDDTYIGGKKKPGKRGRGAKSKVPILLAVESRPKGCGHVSLQKVDSLNSKQVRDFLYQKVQGDAQVFSDGFSTYKRVSKHREVIPIVLGDLCRAVEVFPNVHRVIALLKNWIRGTHTHVSSKHLNRYLAEFSFRFNRRFRQRRKTIFDRLVKACCSTQTVTYKELVAELN
jgi:transposase-like protein